MTCSPFVTSSSILCLRCVRSKRGLLECTCSMYFMEVLIACKVVYSPQVTDAKSNRTAASPCAMWLGECMALCMFPFFTDFL